MIKKQVEILESISIFGEDGYGAIERKQRLNNKMFPFAKIELLNENEYNYLDNYNWNNSNIQPIEQNELLRIYNRVFNQRHEASSCRTCWIEILNWLRVIYDDYKNKL